MSQDIASVLGCRVNVISRAQIRYEGNLLTVKSEVPNDPVIVLSDVISHGTEDRPCEKFVPANPKSFGQIAFRGTNLEDISLVNTDTDRLNDDPSIISSSAGPPPAPIGTRNTQAPVAPPAPAPIKSDFFEQPRQQKQHSGGSSTNRGGHMSGNNSISTSNGPINRGAGHNNHSRGTGSGGYQNNRSAGENANRGGGGGGHGQQHYGNNRGGGGSSGYPNNRSHQNRNQQPITFDQDYNIEEANKYLAAELEKINLIENDATSSVISEEIDAESEPRPTGANDTFSGFFDTLSCEIIDKAKGVPKDPHSRRDERRLNVDTFGNAAYYVHNRRGNYRGGSRGGRGGGGAPRGGQQNNWRRNYNQNGSGSGSRGGYRPNRTEAVDA